MGWERAAGVFCAALERPAHEREGFAQEACGAGGEMLAQLSAERS